MAILVAAGGAALGSTIGLGGAGWLIGSIVGNLLFPQSGPETVSEGPRLGDLSVTGSAYGAPIPIAYGTLRMAGQMIWSAGIAEQKNVSTTRTGGKGGGGGASHTSVTYAYFASFALAFGEGPADDVLRIWADGKLIFDKTGANQQVSKNGLRFRFHRGTETELPDPLIESHVGAGQAPAHRGLCTIVFENLALADYGNRVPNITAEITYRKVDEKPYQLLDLITTSEGGAFDSYQIGDLAIDWRRGYGYFLSSDGNPDAAGIRRFDLRTMREDRQARMSDIAAAEPNTFPERPVVRRGWLSLPECRIGQLPTHPPRRSQRPERGRPLRLRQYRPLQHDRALRRACLSRHGLGPGARRPGRFSAHRLAVRRRRSAQRLGHALRLGRRAGRWTSPAAAGVSRAACSKASARAGCLAAVPARPTPPSAFTRSPSPTTPDTMS